MVKTQYRQDVPIWIARRIKELAAIDPNSTAFRYGNYGIPIDAQDSPIEFEAYVSLSHLQAAMLALNTALVSAVSEIGVSGRRPPAMIKPAPARDDG